MAFLEVDDIQTYYGNIQALKGISIEVEEGEIVTLIGSNGAGKSTTLRSISGLTPPRVGSIRFNGKEIGETAPQEIVRLGISQSPEGRKIFPRMSVRENLDLGAYLRRDVDDINSDLERVFELFPRMKEREKQKAGTMSGGEQQMLAMGRALMARPKLLLLDEPSLGLSPLVVHDLFPRLQERESQKAGTMSGGEQQMLAIGRALMGRPRLLLLDEPSMGIAPILVERIYETVEEINKQGTTILLVEQNANFALGVSNRAYVLEVGQISLSDSSEALRENPDVQRAYLGA